MGLVARISGSQPVGRGVRIPYPVLLERRALTRYTGCMSRARDWTHPKTGEVYWFDVDGAPATDAQLELLAEIEDLEVDEILDANLTQRGIVDRLNKASGLIPQEGLERARRREERQRTYIAPTCAICSVEGWGCHGRMTRHHFVPKWIMLELSNYAEYAPRNKCTVWACMGIHRSLHMRSEGGSKSIAPYLNDRQKAVAEKLLSTLKRERPSLYNLIAAGDRTSYEYQLVRDYQLGRFHLGFFRRVAQRFRHISTG